MNQVKTWRERLEYPHSNSREQQESAMQSEINELRQAIEQAEAEEPYAWVCCVPGQDPCFLLSEPSDERYPPGYKEPLYTRSKS
jgi:hypothetical protein